MGEEKADKVFFLRKHYSFITKRFGGGQSFGAVETEKMETKRSTDPVKVVCLAASKLYTRLHQPHHTHAQPSQLSCRLQSLLHCYIHITNAPKQRPHISASYKLSTSQKSHRAPKLHTEKSQREANHPKHIRVSTMLIPKIIQN